MIQRLPRLALALIAGVCTGCSSAPSSPDTAPAEGSLTDVVARYEGAAAGSSADVATGEPAGELPVEAEPTPVTLDEIRAICRVYRQATYGRWDDQRTRGELGGLDLTSDVAAAWQLQLSSAEASAAAEASRAVLDAAETAGIESACAPLDGFVAVTEGFSGPAPTADPPSDDDSATP